jgi:hypothetical protein
VKRKGLSRTEDLKVDLYACPYCKVKPGDWCVTKSGAFATHIHGGRGEELQAYSWEVYEEGEESGRYYERRKAEREIAELKLKVRQLEQLQMAWVGGA